MSDVVLSALIAAVGGILTATITAYFQYLIVIQTHKSGDNKQNEPKGNSPGRGEPRHKSQPRSKIDWRVTTVITGVVTLVLFVGTIIRVSTRTAPLPTAAISLTAATVEFRISGNSVQIIVPAGGTLETLEVGDQISIETSVKDANGVPYPNPLTVTYYFSSGATLPASVAPYLVSKPDTITVKIEDQVTGEVITRLMHITTN